MDTIYENPSHYAAYGGVKQLHSAVQQDSTKSEVEQFLDKNRTYRKFKKNKTNFKRVRIFALSLGVMFQSDLFDVQKLSRSNNGYRYILVVVDCFSRMIYARPLKRKTAQLTADAFNDIFTHLKNSGTLGARVLMGSDLGTEMYNTEVEKIYDKFEISHFALRAPKKASLAEISGRYLLDRIYKHLFSTGTKRWIDDLENFVNAKNTRPNRTLGGLSSSQVNFENQSTVYDNLYPDRFTRKVSKKPPLTIGTKVQLALDVLPFHKSFHGYFSDETYRIKHRHDYNGLFRYTIEDTVDDQEISGSYYREELLTQ